MRYKKALRLVNEYFNKKKLCSVTFTPSWHDFRMRRYIKEWAKEIKKEKEKQ